MTAGVTVNPYLCQLEFKGWKKNHRKARINKKWHKRYGPIMQCKGVAYQVGGVMRGEIVCCPCVGNELRKLKKCQTTATPWNWPAS